MLNSATNDNFSQARFQGSASRQNYFWLTSNFTLRPQTAPHFSIIISFNAFISSNGKHFMVIVCVFCALYENGLWSSNDVILLWWSKTFFKTWKDGTKILMKDSASNISFIRPWNLQQSRVGFAPDFIISSPFTSAYKRCWKSLRQLVSRIIRFVLMSSFPRNAADAINEQHNLKQGWKLEKVFCSFWLQQKS